jgi:hypothetical protein
MGYYTSYLGFHIALGAIGIATYLLLMYYILPEFVMPDKKVIATEYTNYAFSAYLSTLAIGSVAAQYFDTRVVISEDPTSGPNGGRRKRR